MILHRRIHVPIVDQHVIRRVGALQVIHGLRRVVLVVMRVGHHNRGVLMLGKIAIIVRLKGRRDGSCNVRTAKLLPAMRVTAVRRIRRRVGRSVPRRYRASCRRRRVIRIGASRRRTPILSHSVQSRGRWRRRLPGPRRANGKRTCGRTQGTLRFTVWQHSQCSVIY